MQESPVSEVLELPRTIVYPLVQFTPLFSTTDNSTEHPALLKLLRMLSDENAKSTQWIFSAGYFNLHSELKKLLLASKSSQGVVVTAAPEANGFYGSKGVSSLLPAAYTLLAQRFLGEVQKTGKTSNIKLCEWRKNPVGKDRGAWTYHAKGAVICDTAS